MPPCTLTRIESETQCSTFLVLVFKATMPTLLFNLPPFLLVSMCSRIALVTANILMFCFLIMLLFKWAIRLTRITRHIRRMGYGNHLLPWDQKTKTRPHLTMRNPYSSKCEPPPFRGKRTTSPPNEGEKSPWNVKGARETRESGAPLVPEGGGGGGGNRECKSQP